MMYDPNLMVPPEVVQAVQTIREFAAKHSTGEDWQVGGLGPVLPLQRAQHREPERMNIEDMAVFALRRENAQLRAAGEGMGALLDQMATVMGSTPGNPNALLAAVRDLKARHDQRERELAAATKERDQLHRVVKFADARINRMLEERNPA